MRVFIDTETTGLDTVRHEVIEVSWATDTSEVRTMVVPHSITDADPAALEVNRYFERGLDKAPTATSRKIETFWSYLNGVTLVGANPTFDRSFLNVLFTSQRLRPDPWHHRSLDVESMAAVVLRNTKPVGLRASIQKINDQFDAHLPEPDHTSKGDVIATRALVHWIEQWREWV